MTALKLLGLKLLLSINSVNIKSKSMTPTIINTTAELIRDPLEIFEVDRTQSVSLSLKFDPSKKRITF